MLDTRYMRMALRLAQLGYGATSPNPMVGAVLVKGGQIIGRGWHHRAGEPHAEVEALRSAQQRGLAAKGATLYVTLEPCCTQGRTPPCTRAILDAGIKRVVIGATDPNPRHCGRAFTTLRRAGLTVTTGVLAAECSHLNQAFNHWIVHRTPFVTVKVAMTLDGKIATAAGQSKWITSEQARQYGMWLRQGADAILVGVNTILADNPSLTFREQKRRSQSRPIATPHRLQRIVLDGRARTPLTAKVVCDEQAPLTTIVVTELAPAKRVAALARRVRVLVAPLSPSSDFPSLKVQGSRLAPSSGAPAAIIDLRWVLNRLGSENTTSLLVEGGGEVNASFLLNGLAHQVAFFYAPMLLGGRASRCGVAGDGARSLNEAISLAHVHWRPLGPDWLLTANIAPA